MPENNQEQIDFWDDNHILVLLLQGNSIEWGMLSQGHSPEKGEERL